MMESYVQTHGQPPREKEKHTAMQANARFWLAHARLTERKRKDRIKRLPRYRYHH